VAKPVKTATTTRPIRPLRASPATPPPDPLRYAGALVWRFGRPHQLDEAPQLTDENRSLYPFVPAKAGTQGRKGFWIPACAGMGGGEIAQRSVREAYRGVAA
jgi:hypothetical protein